MASYAALMERILFITVVSILVTLSSCTSPSTSNSSSSLYGGGGGVGAGDPIWCEPIPLPTDDFFLFPQQVWWKEYYSYQNSEDKTITFKVYPTVYSIDMFVGLYTREEDCPQPQLGYYNHFSWYINAPVSVKVDYSAGTLLLMHVRMIGGNYTIMGCVGDNCVEYCPNDCSGHGYCNVTSLSQQGGGGTCVCAKGHAGDDCRNTTCINCHPKKKAPLGSWTLFYSLVAGGPTLVVLMALSIFAYKYISRQDQSRLYTKVGALEGESINSMGVGDTGDFQPHTSRIV